MPVTTDYLIVGAVAALVTVTTTPLVAAVARRFGLGRATRRPARAHDADARRRRHRDVPRLRRRARRRLADGPLRPALPEQLRAARRAAGGDGRVRHRPRRRHLGAVGTGQGDRHRGRRHDPRLVRRDDVLLPRPVPRRLLPVDRLDAADHRAVADRHDAGDQPDRRPRRARRRHRVDRGERVLHLQPPPRRPRVPRTGEHRAADRDHRRRRVPRVPAAQLQPGADLHGRRWSAPARPADGRVARASSAGAPTRGSRPTSPGRRTSSSPRSSSRS